MPIVNAHCLLEVPPELIWQGNDEKQEIKTLLGA